MKRILTLILALAMALGLSVPALSVTSAEAIASAQFLYSLDLFRGVGDNEDGSPNFDLDRVPSRAEAVTMLVRLLGAENKATAENRDCPFTDVPPWAQPYVGYAYINGLTNGVGGNLFGTTNPVTPAQYLTFVLRALGYEDGTDFKWSSPWTLTDRLGITDGTYRSGTTFLRGDAAVVSESALFALKKGTSMTLLEVLAAAGAFRDCTAVIWDYSSTEMEQGYASFLFYPVKGSPATFQSFKLDRVTVNGLGCQTFQVNNTKDVATYLASIGRDAGGFGYVEVTYNYEKVLAAARETYTDSQGNTFPLIGFTFTYTATQQDGSKIKGSFTDYYYFDTRD